MAMVYGVTELQLSLIVIGVLSVGGVWAYNLWQERRHRKLARGVFGTQQKDVLLAREERDGHDGQATVAPSPASDGPSPPSADESPEPPQTDEAVAPVVVAESIGRVERGERIEPVFVTPPDEQAAGGATVVPQGDALVDMADTSSLSRFEPGIDAPCPEAALAGRAEAGGGSGGLAQEAGEVGVAEVASPDIEIAAASDLMDEELPVLDTVVDREPPLELADPVIACIVHLNAPDLVSAPLFWAAQRQILNRLANRIVWSGLDENTARWQRLQANDANSYRRLVGALQLADRNGPVAADDLALYCDGVRQLATHYQALAIVPVVADVLVRARSLDEFCAAVDWRLSLSLVQREGKGLGLETIMQLAEMAGLRRGDLAQGSDAGLQAVDARGRTVFTLSFPGSSQAAEHAASVGSLSLTLDVPLVADGVAAFDRMTQLAHHMMNRLDAVIVDDQRKPLTDEVLARIRTKIGDLQQQMTAHQIPPGGQRAMRLYA